MDGNFNNEAGSWTSGPVATAAQLQVLNQAIYGPQQQLFQRPYVSSRPSTMDPNPFGTISQMHQECMIQGGHSANDLEASRDCLQAALAGPAWYLEPGRG